jgi:hypothetical protein
MRLTLRTLLAYLDDTLEPGEIKTIGQKVAESDAAQELVARIKQVTRRRRLTTPADGGPGERFDANRVASYLDSELSTEEIAEIEKICLESDVHLAEIAATHQILTLVLGEPALVPPTAKRRMYALQHGRPSKAATKPPPVTKSASQEAHAMPEGDPDDALLALPLFRKAPWLRWALPLTAVVLLGVLGVVLWNNLGTSDNRTVNRPSNHEQQPDDKDKQADKDKQPEKDKLPEKDKDKTADKDKKDKTTDKDQGSEKDRKPADKDKPTDKDQGSEKDKKPADKDKKTETPPPEIPAVARPSVERRPIGSFISKEQVLVQRGPDGWKRVGLAEAVQTAEQLVSLPGYKSEVVLDGKVSLLLWGSLPELYQFAPVFLLESAVTLYQPPPGLDLDMTLHRGRVYLTNRKDKGETRVRLRFWREETWDITFEDSDTTIGVEMMSIPAKTIPKDEDPLVVLGFYILKGKASLKREGKTWGELRGPIGRALFVWTNKGVLKGPEDVPRKFLEWEPDQPGPVDARDQRLAKELNASLSELAGSLVDPRKRVSTALFEFMEDTQKPERRLLGIRSLVAIDSVDLLLDALGREDLKRDDVRREALTGLRSWLSRGLEQSTRLYDRKTMTGLLKDRDYSNIESQIILELLQGYSPEEERVKSTYEDLIQLLRHSKPLIRDLAIRQLLYLAPGQNIDYNPLAPAEARDRGIEAWKKLLDTGKLPPPPPKAPPPMRP